MKGVLKKKAQGIALYVKNSESKAAAVLNVLYSLFVIVPLSLVHEASHLLAAFVLRVPLVLDKEQLSIMTYMPKKNELMTFWMTFHPVRFKDRPVRYALVALAPLVPGIAAFIAYPMWLTSVLENWFIPPPAHYPEFWAVLATAFFTVVTLVFILTVVLTLAPSPGDVQSVKNAVSLISYKRRMKQLRKELVARLVELDRVLERVKNKYHLEEGEKPVEK